MVHASNVTGALQPAEEVGRIAAEKNVLFLLDAAQTLGHWPIDVQRLGCHLLAAPGHKGLLGPLGTGILYLAPGLERQLDAVRQGGTGTRSDDTRQPTELPDRFESGNLNVPGIVGLSAGVAEVLKLGVSEIAQRQSDLANRLIAALSAIPGIATYGPCNAGPRIGVVSFNLEGWDPRELSTLLDSQWSIQSRAGLHCAPKMHQTLGTLPAGCVRVSLGPFNTGEDIDALVDALTELSAD
jgi:cysteine desulfurase / selenocysteine lyase